VKPRAFIGSSGASKKFAQAIHVCLQGVAECTVWTDGAFGLSKSTLDGLMKNLRDSDFAVFVFAPDDIATIKGELLQIPRDNVVYEAGLFSGFLCPERCFIAVPDAEVVHLPTDLLGITVGKYESTRTDRNYEAAVSAFCFRVIAEIEKLGLFKNDERQVLAELCTRFDCCDWIREKDPRIEQKRKIGGEIEAFCRSHNVNKHRLLAHHTLGRYMALLGSIRFHPEDGDCSLIMQMDVAKLPSGFAHYRVMDAAEAIKARKVCNPDQMARLGAWLKKLPETNTDISDRIARF
jgi:hypothetical protein